MPPKSKWKGRSLNNQVSRWLLAAVSPILLVKVRFKQGWSSD
jgi:hypothetical protein